MRPLLLTGAFAVLLAMLLFVAQIKSDDDTSSNTYPSGDMLAVNFAHADHVEQPCVDCHHNFVDETGQGLCFDCHITDAEVAALIETQFHDLCRGCHEKQAALGEAHGPTRQCIDCHVSDDRP